MRRRPLGCAVAVAALLAAAGCHTDMYEQPKYRPLEETTFFPDGNSSRPLPEDTVPRGRASEDELLTTGKIDGKVADVFPFPVTRDLLDRGRNRFDVFCSPCHGRTGDGRGMVVRRGFKQPPSYHTDRMRKLPAGHVFDVITNGFGAMYDYKARIAPADRWAIVAYVRALQLSEHATTADVPPDALAKLEKEAR